MNPEIGVIFNVKKIEPYMFYADDMKESLYLLELMKRNRLIHFAKQKTIIGSVNIDHSIMIEEKGWEFIEKILKKENSTKAFIAMWFDSSMDAAALKIEKAVRDLGFDPIRIDRKEFNNEISGEILYEIKQCKFLIADVTKQRQGVYFEAGYALGQGIPVIWSCKKDDLNNIHFDTRQYNHIIWETEEDLSLQLSNRIKGTILLP